MNNVLTKPPALCARILDFKQRAVLAGMQWAPVAGLSVWGVAVDLTT